MNKKLMFAAGLSSVVLLAGCASGPDQATTNQLNNLTAKVDQLSQQVSALQANQNQALSAAQSAAAQAAQAKDAAMAAQAEAARANDRIDNIATSYTK
jgi:murein lipoprotein